MRNISAIILAAGEGTRLNEGKPSPKAKVLFEVAGKPMIFYSLDILKSLEVDDVVIVIGHLGETVKQAVGETYTFATQKKVTGTGEATRVGLAALAKKNENIMVLNGADIYQREVVEELMAEHLGSDAVVSFLTIEMDDPTGYGRIIRDGQGNLVADVEDKVATEEQKKIKEINDGCYLFKRNWLESSLQKLRLSKANEYFLTDLIELAIQEDRRVNAHKMTTQGWFGVDTPEQLALTSKFVKLKWDKKK